METGSELFSENRGKVECRTAVCMGGGTWGRPIAHLAQYPAPPPLMSPGSISLVGIHRLLGLVHGTVGAG